MAGVLPHESHKIIGYHVGNRVLCPTCAEQRTGERSALYFVNVFPYKQHCHDCGAEMCRGQTDAWSELFPHVPEEKPSKGRPTFRIGGRRRPMVNLTLSLTAREMLRTLASAAGTSQSAYVESLIVRDAKAPQQGT